MIFLLALVDVARLRVLLHFVTNPTVCTVVLLAVNAVGRIISAADRVGLRLR